MAINKIKGSVAGAVVGIVGPVPQSEAEPGGLPTGGTTGQPLIKTSDADFDVEFNTLQVIGGGTGQITLTSHALLVGAGTSPITQIAVPANGTVLQGNAGAVPTWTATPTLGVAGTTLGAIHLENLTSGSITVQPVTGALGASVLSLPAATDTLVGKATTDTFSNKTIDTAASNTIKINGNLLTATVGTATVTVQNSTDTLVSRNTTDTLTNKTLISPVIGSAGEVFDGSTSGTTTLKATAVASGTLTLPAATDTLIGKATTDILTNKTFDTAGIGNSLLINGLAATANTGTGAVVRATGPTISSATINGASVTTINNVVITPVATAATLTIPNGVAFTGPATSGTAMTLGNAETVTGAKSFNSGTVIYKGSSSGTTTLNATAVASGTLTLPAATDTIVGKATTDTFTNKTFDTAGTGNSLLINGLAATANTGTGAVVRATGPTLTTPTLGAATVTTVNNVVITAPATAATLTIPNGVTLTGPAASGTVMTLGNAETVTGAKTFNSGKLIYGGSTSGTTTLNASATASGTLTLPAATDTLVGKATTDTFTNKTFDTAGTGNSLLINGVAATDNSGSGKIARQNSPVFLFPSTGAAGSANGQITFNGSTSGIAILAVATSGSNSTFVLPTNNGTNGFPLTSDGFGNTNWTAISSSALPSNVKIAAISFIVDGGGSAITTGIKGDLSIPFACTISAWTLLADQSGSIVVNVWKDTFANYPPTVADKITSTTPPTISSAASASSSTLTGWTTSISAGDTLRFNVDSVSTIQRVTLVLAVSKT